ncbi:hypothetical protein [Aneurinibacillus terranovensis]|uniref:hypothetical protein n=1 Tax=Aneurinibacillus terranovensis TaxID=278991 RepID=UPI000401FBA4|nr:hypothetical protein [Aneurinibacillus terranovensis]
MMTTINNEKTTIYMMLSGQILWDTYGESFGYLEKPSFLRIPVDEVEICPDWICETERGVIYIQKEKTTVKNGWGEYCY